MDIKAIIENKINASGMSKRAVTELAGINSGNLNKMLDSPSWPTLERIARALGISVSELVREDGSPQPMQGVCPHCGKPITIEVELK